MIPTCLWYSRSCTRSRHPFGGGQLMVRSGHASSCRTRWHKYSRNWHPNSENWHLNESSLSDSLSLCCVYLCFTLSTRAAAKLLVLSPSCRLQVGQCSTRFLQDLQMMWPAASYSRWVPWENALTCGAAGDGEVPGYDQAHGTLHHWLKVPGRGAEAGDLLFVWGKYSSLIYIKCLFVYPGQLPLSWCAWSQSHPFQHNWYVMCFALTYIFFKNPGISFRNM